MEENEEKLKEKKSAGLTLLQQMEENKMVSDILRANKNIKLYKAFREQNEQFYRNKEIEEERKKEINEPLNFALLQIEMLEDKVKRRDNVISTLQREILDKNIEKNFILSVSEKEKEREREREKNFFKKNQDYSSTSSINSPSSSHNHTPLPSFPNSPRSKLGEVKGGEGIRKENNSDTGLFDPQNLILIEELRDRLAQYIKVIEFQQDYIEKHKKTINFQNDKIKQLLAYTNTLNFNFTESIQKLESERDIYYGLVQTKEEKINEIFKEKDQLSLENNLLKSKIDSLNYDLNYVKKQNLEYSNLITNNNRKEDELLNNIKSLELNLVNVTTEKFNIQEKLNDIERRYSNLVQELDKMVQEGYYIPQSNDSNINTSQGNKKIKKKSSGKSSKQSSKKFSNKINKLNTTSSLQENDDSEEDEIEEDSFELKPPVTLQNSPRNNNTRMSPETFSSSSTFSSSTASPFTNSSSVASSSIPPSVGGPSLIPLVNQPSTMSSTFNKNLPPSINTSITKPVAFSNNNSTNQTNIVQQSNSQVTISSTNVSSPSKNPTEIINSNIGTPLGNSSTIQSSVAKTTLEFQDSSRISQNMTRTSFNSSQTNISSTTVTPITSTSSSPRVASAPGSSSAGIAFVSTPSSPRIVSAASLVNKEIPNDGSVITFNQLKQSEDNQLVEIIDTQNLLRDNQILNQQLEELKSQLLNQQKEYQEAQNQLLNDFNQSHNENIELTNEKSFLKGRVSELEKSLNAMREELFMANRMNAQLEEVQDHDNLDEAMIEMMGMVIKQKEIDLEAEKALENMKQNKPKNKRRKKGSLAIRGSFLANNISHILGSGVGRNLDEDLNEDDDDEEEIEEEKSKKKTKKSKSNDLKEKSESSNSNIEEGSSYVPVDLMAYMYDWDNVRKHSKECQTDPLPQESIEIQYDLDDFMTPEEKEAYLDSLNSRRNDTDEEIQRDEELMIMENNQDNPNYSINNNPDSSSYALTYDEKSKENDHLYNDVQSSVSNNNSANNSHNNSGRSSPSSKRKLQLNNFSRLTSPKNDSNRYENPTRKRTSSSGLPSPLSSPQVKNKERGKIYTVERNSRGRSPGGRFFFDDELDEQDLKEDIQFTKKDEEFENCFETLYNGLLLTCSNYFPKEKVEILKLKSNNWKSKMIPEALLSSLDLEWQIRKALTLIVSFNELRNIFVGKYAPEENKTSFFNQNTGRRSTSPPKLTALVENNAEKLTQEARFELSLSIRCIDLILQSLHHILSPLFHLSTSDYPEIQAMLEKNEQIRVKSAGGYTYLSKTKKDSEEDSDDFFMTNFKAYQSNRRGKFAMMLLQPQQAQVEETYPIVQSTNLTSDGIGAPKGILKEDINSTTKKAYMNSSIARIYPQNVDSILDLIDRSSRSSYNARSSSPPNDRVKNLSSQTNNNNELEIERQGKGVSFVINSDDIEKVSLKNNNGTNSLAFSTPRPLTSPTKNRDSSPTSTNVNKIAFMTNFRKEILKPQTAPDNNSSSLNFSSQIDNQNEGIIINSFESNRSVSPSNKERNIILKPTNNKSDLAKYFFSEKNHQDILSNTKKYYESNNLKSNQNQITEDANQADEDLITGIYGVGKNIFMPNGGDFYENYTKSLEEIGEDKAEVKNTLEILEKSEVINEKGLEETNEEDKEKEKNEKNDTGGNFSVSQFSLHSTYDSMHQSQFNASIAANATSAFNQVKPKTAGSMPTNVQYMNMKQSFDLVGKKLLENEKIKVITKGKNKNNDEINIEKISTPSPLPIIPSYHPLAQQNSGALKLIDYSQATASISTSSSVAPPSTAPSVLNSTSSSQAALPPPSSNPSIKNSPRVRSASLKAAQSLLSNRPPSSNSSIPPKMIPPTPLSANSKYYSPRIQRDLIMNSNNSRSATPNNLFLEFNKEKINDEDDFLSIPLHTESLSDCGLFININEDPRYNTQDINKKDNEDDKKDVEGYEPIPDNFKKLCILGNKTKKVLLKDKILK